MPLGPRYTATNFVGHTSNAHAVTYYGPYVIHSFRRNDGNHSPSFSCDLTLVREPPPEIDVLIVGGGGGGGSANQNFGAGNSSGGGGGGGGGVAEFLGLVPFQGTTALVIGGGAGSTLSGGETQITLDGSGSPDWEVIGGGGGGASGSPPAGTGDDGACGGGGGEGTGGLQPGGLGTIGFNGGDGATSVGGGGGGGMGAPGTDSTALARGDGGDGITSSIRTGSPVYYGGGGGGGGRLGTVPGGGLESYGSAGLGNGVSGSGGGGTGAINNFPPEPGFQGWPGIVVIRYLAYPAGWRLGVQFQGGGIPL